MIYLVIASLVLLTSFSALNFFDYKSTRWIFQYPGAYEDNPIMAWWFKLVGFEFGLLSAKTVPAIGMWTLFFMGGAFHPLILGMLLVVCIYYANVMLKNWDWIQRKKASIARAEAEAERAELVLALSK